jgi:hypothetical protein
MTLLPSLMRRRQADSRHRRASFEERHQVGLSDVFGSAGGRARMREFMDSLLAQGSTAELTSATSKRNENRDETIADVNF